MKATEEEGISSQIKKTNKNIRARLDTESSIEGTGHTGNKSRRSVSAALD